MVDRRSHAYSTESFTCANFTKSGGTPQYEEAKSAIDLLRHDHDFFMRELATAVNVMREHETVSDHDVVSRQLNEVRRSIVKVQNRLDTDNQLEENHVYEWVNVLFGEAERSALAACIRHEIENIPPQFKF